MKPHTRTLAVLCAFVLVFPYACTKDTGSESDLDNALAQALIDASGGQGTGWYRFPASDDFAKIPQDPSNPLNAAKVELGKLLYHETGIALDPNAIRVANVAAVMVTANLPPFSRTGARIDFRPLEVGPLALAEAEELALERLGDASPEARHQAALIARESDGTPLFVEELARFSGTAADRGRLSLHQVIVARLGYPELNSAIY